MTKPSVQFQLSGPWCVAMKPAGWLTIAASNPSENPHPVLRSYLEAELKRQLWVVHRIDIQTSGLVLFALNAGAHREASIWFEKHQVRKAYDFIASGSPRLPIQKIDKPIEGARSITQLELKERFGKECFLGRAVPLTGKRHQIRIHLSGEGSPILGDSQYGGLKKWGALSIDRVALHAAKLELPDGQKFEAPWPEDFKSWVAQLRALRT